MPLPVTMVSMMSRMLAWAGIRYSPALRLEVWLLSQTPKTNSHLVSMIPSLTSSSAMASTPLPRATVKVRARVEAAGAVEARLGEEDAAADGKHGDDDDGDEKLRKTTIGWRTARERGGGGGTGSGCSASVGLRGAVRLSEE